MSSSVADRISVRGPRRVAPSASSALRFDLGRLAPSTVARCACCGANRPCGAGRRRGRRGRRIRGRVPPRRGRPGCGARRRAGRRRTAVAGSTPSSSPRMRSRSSSVHVRPAAMLYTRPEHALAGAVGRGEVGGDDVGDVGEVAATGGRRRAPSGARPASSASTNSGITAAYVASGSLPGAVHVEVPQRDRLEPVQLAEHAAVVLGRELRHRVRRARAAVGVVLGVGSGAAPPYTLLDDACTTRGRRRRVRP